MCSERSKTTWDLRLVTKERRTSNKFPKSSWLAPHAQIVPWRKSGSRLACPMCPSFDISCFYCSISQPIQSPNVKLDRKPYHSFPSDFCAELKHFQKIGFCVKIEKMFWFLSHSQRKRQHQHLTKREKNCIVVLVTLSTITSSFFSSYTYTTSMATLSSWSSGLTTKLFRCASIS